MKSDNNARVLDFPKYHLFLRYLSSEYKPYITEFFTGNDKFMFKDKFYAMAHAKRFYVSLQHFNLYFPVNGAKVLDVGGYPGTMLKILRKYGRTRLLLYQCGLYFDPDFVKDMESHDIVTLPPVDIDPPTHYQQELEKKHGFRIGMDNEVVDYVIATEVLEHLVYPLHFFSEAYRILKPGGRIYITTPNIAKSSAWVRVLLGKSNLDPLRQTQIYMHDKWRGHVRLYSRDELEFLLKDNKFNVLKSTTINNSDYLIERTSLLRKIDFTIRLCIEFLLPWTKPGLLVVAEKPL